MNPDRQLEEQFDEIPWREAMPVKLAGGVSRLCCRYCIANHGLRAADVGRVGFATKAEFEEHLRREHGV